MRYVEVLESCNLQGTEYLQGEVVELTEEQYSNLVAITEKLSTEGQPDQWREVDEDGTPIE